MDPLSLVCGALLVFLLLGLVLVQAAAYRPADKYDERYRNA